MWGLKGLPHVNSEERAGLMSALKPIVSKPDRKRFEVAMSYFLGNGAGSPESGRFRLQFSTTLSSLGAISSASAVEVQPPEASSK